MTAAWSAKKFKRPKGPKSSFGIFFSHVFSRISNASRYKIKSCVFFTRLSLSEISIKSIYNSLLANKMCGLFHLFI